MTYCTECGEKNSDTSTFCTKCGHKFLSEETDSSFEQRVENFAENMGKLGEQTGKKAKKVVDKVSDNAEKIEKKFDATEKNVEQWYERVFGVFGPLLSSFIGLIILRLIIEAFTSAGQTVSVLGEIGDILFVYLLLIFAAILLSSYTEYFSRKFTSFQWVSPVFSALCVGIFLWVAIQILSSLGISLGIQTLSTIASFIENYFLMIVVFVILIGYVIVLAKVSWEKETKG